MSEFDDVLDVGYLNEGADHDPEDGDGLEPQMNLCEFDDADEEVTHPDAPNPPAPDDALIARFEHLQKEYGKQERAIHDLQSSIDPEQLAKIISAAIEAATAPLLTQVESHQKAIDELTAAVEPIDMEAIAQLITGALSPLETAINELHQENGEESRTDGYLTTFISEIGESLHKAINDLASETSPDAAYNVSALQFQAAMLQPCNGQILPASVRDEIDRLYAVEDAHNIAKRAEQALNHLLDHDPILLKIPDDLEEQQLMMAVLNAWYTKAYPERNPLKLSSAASCSP